jgi:hypothetical protein
LRSLPGNKRIKANRKDEKLLNGRPSQGQESDVFGQIKLFVKRNVLAYGYNKWQKPEVYKRNIWNIERIEMLRVALQLTVNDAGPDLYTMCTFERRKFRFPFLKEPGIPYQYPPLQTNKDGCNEKELKTGVQ